MDYFKRSIHNVFLFSLFLNEILLLFIRIIHKRNFGFKKPNYSQEITNTKYVYFLYLRIITKFLSKVIVSIIPLRLLISPSIPPRPPVLERNKYFFKIRS